MTMKQILSPMIVLIAALLSDSTKAAGLPTQFRGYAAVSEMLSERLGLNVQFSYYVGSDALGQLLGVYKGDGLTSGFINGQANATNMMLWYYAFQSLAADVATVCTPTPAPIKSWLGLDYLTTLLPLCAWPAADARKEETLMNFWIANMSYDAPSTEYEAWRDFFLAPAYANSPANAVVSDMMTAIFLNPHFLLRK